MEQQQASFNESASYAARHEEAPQYSGHFSDSHRQKLSPQRHRMAATAGQRLILAIVSLALFLLIFLVIIVLIVTKEFTLTVAISVIPVSLALIAAVIVVNIVFNQKQ